MILKHTIQDLRSGIRIPYDNGNPMSKPHWFDQTKFDRARAVFREYSVSILFAHFSGLILIFLYTSLVEPFLYTGKSKNIPVLLKRYIHTALHVRQWYIGDIWNPKDPAHKSILAVKAMHKTVADKMDDPKNGMIAPKGMLFFSQSGMAITQFTFIGWIILYPKQTGIHCSKDDLECLIHFWRCIGYLLGMEDKFNICDGNYNESSELFKAIIEEEIKPNINSLESGIAMSRDIVVAMSKVVPFLSWLAIKRYWFEILDLQIDFQLNFYDNICYWVYHFLVSILFKWEITRKLLNYFQETVMQKADINSIIK